MATLGVAAGGAGLGFALGGPLGASVGWIAGTVIGNLLFGDGNDAIEGPRLTDFTVATAYGKIIKKGYGTGRIKLDLLWLKGNRFDEVTEKETVGGKGIGGGTKTRTRKYYATFIAGAGEGPATGVRRIWADRKLIYDVTGNSPAISTGGFAFSFVPGDEEQLPDPDYTADVGIAPALRGEVYLKFLDFPLANYGNRIPDLEAEIVWEAFTSSPSLVYSETAWILQNADDTNAHGINYIRDQIYRIDSPNSEVIDWETGLDLAQIASQGTISGVDNNGDYLMATTNINRRWSSLIFEQTLQLSPYNGFEFSKQVTAIKGPLGELICGLRSAFNSVTNTGARFWEHNTLQWHSDWAPLGVNTVVRGFVTWEQGTGRVVYRMFDTLDLSKVHLYSYSIVAAITPSNGTINGGGLFEEKIGEIEASDIDPSETVFANEAQSILYDPTDGSFILTCKLGVAGTNQWMVKWSPTIGIRWKTFIPNATSTGLNSSTPAHYNGDTYRLVGNRVAWIADTGSGNPDPIVSVRLYDGFFEVLSADAAATRYSGNQFYDDVTGHIFDNRPTGNALNKWQLGTVPTVGVGIAKIYEDRHDKAGIDITTELNVTGITESIPFYLIDRSQSERRNIEPLMATFRHTAATQDNVITFDELGGNPVFTLDERDMEPSRNGDPAEFTKVNEGELPSRLSLAFMDIDADYQQADQPAQLITDPVHAVNTKVTITMGLNGGLDVSTAIQIADRLLTTAWLERDNYKGKPNIEFLEYTPGLDSGTITRLDNSTQQIRLLDSSLGSDWSLQTSFVSEDSADFVLDPGLIGDSGRLPNQIIEAQVRSELFLLNTTTLRDEDLTDRTFSRGLWVGAPIKDIPWPGANLFSGAEPEDLGSTTSPVAYGVVSTAPPADDEYTNTNEGSSFEATFVTGFDDLASVTQLQMLNGANSVFIFKPSTGEGEVMSFRDFTDLGDNRGRFENLIRGRRGTNTYIPAHAVGDYIVVLDRPDIQDIRVTLGQIGTATRFELITIGAISGDVETFTYIGNDLMPWTVAQITAEVVSTDIQIDWVRRTRANGGLQDGTGNVPLNEDTEEYDLEIYDGPAGTLLRTVNGLTSPTYLYLNADILTDIGYIPGTLTVRIYQVSAQVGRGFSEETTVDVT